jgi:hypothetical protein
VESETEASKIKALGYSQTSFNPKNPGRLCRGRERWIEPWQVDGEGANLSRLVISGAVFTDDSARDARRGLPYSEVDVPQLITSLFPRRTLLAFMEDGHAADIPQEAEGIEAYEGYRAGGASTLGLVRWFKRIAGVREIRAILGEKPFEYADRIRGFAVLASDSYEPELFEQLFLLVGMSTLDSPPARYQPAALAQVLDSVKAVLLFHRDKHGPALGVYSKDPVKTEGRIDTLCTKTGTLPVKFAIPPMLARWDRALSELRTEWEATKEEPFPVPAAPDRESWQPRRRRRKGQRGKAGAPEPPVTEPTESEPAKEPAEPEPAVEQALLVEEPTMEQALVVEEEAAIEQALSVEEPSIEEPSFEDALTVEEPAEPTPSPEEPAEPTPPPEEPA